MPFYDSLLNVTMPVAFYSDEFRQTLYSHLAHLKATARESITIEPAQAVKYVGNLKALLDSKGVPTWMHWVTMLVNEVENDYRHIESVRQILIPDSNEVENIFARWSAKKR